MGCSSGGDEGSARKTSANAEDSHNLNGMILVAIHRGRHLKALGATEDVNAIDRTCVLDTA